MQRWGSHQTGIKKGEEAIKQASETSRITNKYEDIIWITFYVETKQGQLEFFNGKH